MLFGRKTPPTANPKPADAEPAPAPAPEAAVPASPPAQPVPGLSAPAEPAPAPAPLGAPISATPPVATPLRPPFSDKGPEMNTTPPKPPAGPLNAGPTSPASSFKPSDIPRRTVDLPGARKPDGYAIPTPPAAAVPPPPAPAPAPVIEQRRLIVGRDISLSGEIGSCDVLVVEGTVEAKLRDGRSIEITENGLFKGSVEIDEADIGGRFEGDITVRGRLTVRSTGKITGAIKYGELMVEAGGQLIGDVQVVSATTKPAAPAPAPIAAQPLPSFAPVGGE
ncbi:bactofilin family protein [Azospirillum sp.]|uniref:bactofilin family protein n=1 Tax=Azospirillum sp. TaxID=34012 RepID=UPI003D7224CF